MTESVPSAPPSDSSGPAGERPEPANIIERIEQYAAEHPEATEYRITTEAEAAQILLAIAAVLKHLRRDVHNDREGRAKLKKIGQEYRLAVAQGKALEYIFSMTEEDQLEIRGLVLVVDLVGRA